MFNVSFDPKGKWFVFDEAGRTVKANFRSKPLAQGFVARLEEDAERAKQAAEAEHLNPLLKA